MVRKVSESDRRKELYLRDIVEKFDYSELPSEWTIENLAKYTREITLYPYQQQAVENAIICLYQFYEENQGSKSNFMDKYKDIGLNEVDIDDYAINTAKLSDELLDLLISYDIPISDDGYIAFQEFINRMCFWMATGSGKTLILIKLIEVLKKLINSRAIDQKEFLILTFRDDLILQLKKEVRDYNQNILPEGIRIRLESLKDYESIQRRKIRLSLDEILVYYYRSDLISTKDEDKKINFMNRDNGGNWYVFLDEAHKGNKKGSKRQHYYSIMARNGFLFNFSATFDEVWDFSTTVFNFNLERFISQGYGKHLYISKGRLSWVGVRSSQFEATLDDKKVIILKALILWKYLKDIKKIIDTKNISSPKFYHAPMIVVFVHSVNLKKNPNDETIIRSDLILFFQALRSISNYDATIETELFNTAKEELRREFPSSGTQLKFENENLEIRWELIKNIKFKEVHKEFFHKVENKDILLRSIPKTNKEALLALKLSPPFGLIKIGDATDWIHNEVDHYNIEESVEDISYFENIEEKEEISLLMGSRAFYEGWDTNRPNIILFLNIGVSDTAKKFVLQAIGRGVRIQPIKRKRKRLSTLLSEMDENEEFFDELNEIHTSIPAFVQNLETLFIFGTDPSSIKNITSSLKVVEKFKLLLELQENPKNENSFLLLPTYEDDQNQYQMENPEKFPVSQDQFDFLKRYFLEIKEKIIFIKHNITIPVLKSIQQSLTRSLTRNNKYY